MENNVISIWNIFFLLVDDYFQFSYNAKLNSQIEQIAKIEEIVNNTNDSLLIKKLKIVENKIIDTRSTSDYLYFLSSRLYNSISRHTVNAATNISANPIIHYLTSNWLLILFIFWIFKGLKRYILTYIIWYILAAGMTIVIVFWLTGLTTALLIPSQTEQYLKLLYNVLIQGFFGLIFYVFILYSGRSIEKSNSKEDKKKVIDNQDLKSSEQKTNGNK